MMDEEARKAWPDPLGRTPKSASSQWKGTLEGTNTNPCLVTGSRTDSYHEAELALWAFNEAWYSDECGFKEGYNIIYTALNALGINPLPKSKGGDNQGYSIEHWDEDAVDEDGDQIIEIYDQTYIVNKQEYHVPHTEVLSIWYN